MGDIDKSSRKPKPQQELYRPGSGPLRKLDRQTDEDAGRSGNGYRHRGSYGRPANDRTNAISDIADTLKQISIINQEGTRKDDEPQRDGRRPRKPDNALYVPRGLVKAREEQSKVPQTPVDQSIDSAKKPRRKSESKRKKSRRGGGKDGGRDDDQPAEETLRETTNRVERAPAAKQNEEKVEETYRNDQHPPHSEEHRTNKPPFFQGRRGSRGGMPFSKFEHLPPRFQKMYMEGNGHRFPGMSDENWDVSATPAHRDPPTRDYDNVVPRGRGRRLNQDHRANYSSQSERFARSLTPERLKERPEPLVPDHRAVSNELLAQVESRGWKDDRPRREDREWRNSDRPPRNSRYRNDGRPSANDRQRNELMKSEEPTRNEERRPRNKSDRIVQQEDFPASEIVEDTPATKQEQPVEETTEPVEETNKEGVLPRRSSGKLYNPESNQLEEVTTEFASKPFDKILDWAAEVEMCEELEMLDDEPFMFAKPADPPPQQMKPQPQPLLLQPLLPPHQPPHHQPSHHQSSRSRRNRRRSGSRGRNSRRNSMDYGSNNPSRNNSMDRSGGGGWNDGNWRMRRDREREKEREEENHSRQSSMDRGDAWASSLERRRTRRRRSSERSTGTGGGGGRRRRSSEKSVGGGGGGRRRRSSERSASGRAPDNTNWRLEPRPFEDHHQRDAPRNYEQSKARVDYSEARGEPSKPQGILVLPPSHDSSPVNVPPAYHSPPQRQLFNPANPDKPIVVSPSRISAHEENSYTYQFAAYPPHFANNMGEQISAGKPLLYDSYLKMPKAKNYHLMQTMEQADSELQYLVSTSVFKEWDRITTLRTFLKESLKKFLLKELKFCESENVEQHFWRILYYNIIELLRKLMLDQPDDKERCRNLLLNIIDEGREYYEDIISSLEYTYKVKFDCVNPTVQELSGFPALSLISAQKLFLFLGDLARYREQALETSNYGQARQWYLKANQMNPKNGRPYYQLAILAFYTGRQIDAVYYYMRTLIASSPLPSARESLVHIFDENRKKYEAEEKKKKEEKEARERERMREKEGRGGGLRREVWVHPGGKKNLHRTSTSAATAIATHGGMHHEDIYSLAALPPNELNKRFSMCYLHVIGKVFTKIGLESLNETATQMLKEFRALLHHSPVQIAPTRFIQIMALNMFILEITQPKNEEVDSCYRSTLQESALVISLEMFNIVLERFISLVGLNQPVDVTALPPDCLELLPPIKIWCDWLITHVEVWNPPPSSHDFSVGAGNCWEKLASLVNILERMTQSCDSTLEHSQKEGYEFILLPENATLAAYTPLMANSEEPVFMKPNSNLELAQNCLRVHRLLFFGTVFLCGMDPPALKLHKMESGEFHYISIVDTSNSQEVSETEVFFESESESGVSEESEDSGKASGTEDEPAVPTQLRQLIETRQRLESLARKQMYKQSRTQKLLKEQEIVVEMEIRPKYLLPDTNCFIDYLDLLTSIVKNHTTHPYVIMVPLVVVNELEGLSKVCKPGPSVTHAAHVKEAARDALHLLRERHPALKSVTTKGHTLNSTTFIIEEDSGPEMKNDDKILATCLNLCRMNKQDDVTEDGKRKLYREVVLLTEDRNLRLKALSKDVPVRELPDFIAWAGLG